MKRFQSYESEEPDSGPIPKQLRTSDHPRNLVSYRPLVSPGVLRDESYPLTPEIEAFIAETKTEVSKILSRQSSKFICVVGPSSVHDCSAASEYAARLKEIADQPEIKENLVILMKASFGKPRTSEGWQGLIIDPYLNGSFDINKGLMLARMLLLEINQMGLPCASSFVDSISPPYTSDLVSYHSICSNFSESQTHRDIASSLDSPVGFKSGRDGGIQIAVDSVVSSMRSHTYIGVNDRGLTTIMKSKGNPKCHVILRGSTTGPNYSAEDVDCCVDLLREKLDVYNGVIIDCAHDNAGKDHKNQIKVVENVVEQIESAQTRRSSGNQIVGVFIVSNLVAGSQELVVGRTDPKSLVYGKSVSDECADIETTEVMLKLLAAAVKKRRIKLNL